MLRVDGGFKSGVDVMIAAAMGADEYGFGSVAMIATGCIMARICHTNNCPVGVASQVSDEDANFKCRNTLLVGCKLTGENNFLGLERSNWAALYEADYCGSLNRLH